MAAEAVPLVVQLIPRAACRFSLTWTGASSVSPDVSIAQSVCVYLAPASAHYILSPLSVPPLPSWVPDLPLFLSHPPPPLFNLFLFHPNLFCPSAPLAKPSSELLHHSQRYCSRTDSSAISDTVRHVEECWVPKLGDFTSAAKCRRCITDLKKSYWVKGNLEESDINHFAKAAGTEAVVSHKDQTRSNSDSAALYSLSEWSAWCKSIK